MRPVLLAAALACALSGAAGAADLDAGPFVEARLTRVEGSVTVLPAGSPGPARAAEAGTPLEEGDTIRAGLDGSAEVALDGDSLIELQPRTQVTVSSLARRDLSLSLGFGSLIAKIRHAMLAGGVMTVHTKAAVAAVRGTEFGVEEEAGFRATAAVFEEGRVAVTDADGRGEIVLEPGRECAVLRGHLPDAPHALEHFARLRTRMGALRARVAAAKTAWKPLPAARRRALRQELTRRDEERRSREEPLSRERSRGRVVKAAASRKASRPGEKAEREDRAEKRAQKAHAAEEKKASRADERREERETKSDERRR